MHDMSNISYKNNKFTNMQEFNYIRRQRQRQQQYDDITIATILTKILYPRVQNG